MPALPPTASYMYPCQPFMVLPILSNVSTRDITSIPLWYQADRRSHARCRRNAWFFKVLLASGSQTKRSCPDDLWGYCQRRQKKTMKWSLNSTATAFCIIKCGSWSQLCLRSAMVSDQFDDFCGCMKSKTAMNVGKQHRQVDFIWRKYIMNKIWSDFTIYWKL